MATDNSATGEDNDELVCPITMEVFRDPVLAGDGRVYEREAISRWIAEHGTSPFTREPLRVDQLQPDDRLRQLASKRRNSTVSFHAKNNTVILPPLRTNRRVYPELYPNIGPYHSTSQGRCGHCKCNMVMIGSICVCVFILLSIMIGIIIGVTTSQSTGSTAAPQMMFSGALTSNSPQFSRPPNAQQGSSSYYYQSISMVVSTAGSYQIQSISAVDLFGLLYISPFNPALANANLRAYNDDGAGNQQFLLSSYLISTTYVIVVTTYSPNVTGPFSISVRGPATVTLQ